MPENYIKNINMYHLRKIMCQHKLPRPTENIPKNRDVQLIPDPAGSTTFPEYVCIGFKNSRATLAPGILKRFDITVMEVCTGVEPAMEEEPRKELNLCRQLGSPNPRNI